MECAGQKLAVDFRTQSRLRGHMNQSNRETIVRLCAEAGMRMEDASPIAITISQWSNDEFQSVLDQLIATAEEIAALLGAARTLSQ